MHWSLLALSYLLTALSTPAGGFRNEACFNSRSCGPAKFCFTGLAEGQRSGQCVDAWACCMFPERFRACPSSVSGVCATLAPGESELPVLQDRRSAFLEQYIASTIGADVGDWLQTQRSTLPPALYSALNTSLSGLTGEPLFSALSALSVSNTVCGPAHGGAHCPCTPTSPRLPCLPGLHCSAAAYAGLTYMLFDDPVLHSVQAVCVPCGQGEFCNHTVRMQCPAGSYCSSPASLNACPAGSYCPAGSTKPSSCSLSPLAPTSRQALVADVGNWCPVNSSAADGPCPAGHFCPDASQKIACPTRHFCGPRSTAPRQCPPLSRCTQQGASEPARLAAPFVFFAGTVAAMALIVLLNKWWLWRYAAAAAASERAPCCSSAAAVCVPVGAPDDKKRVPASVRRLERLQLRSVSTPWLRQTTATFVSCGLNGIIGGSGCGKSTFLDLMRGNCSDMSGSVVMKLEGDEALELDLARIHTPAAASVFARMKASRGFVPQDDVLYGDLTVYENILFSCKLKTALQGEDLHEVARFAVQQLGLTAVQHHIVGSVDRRGISGGQRKRVNVGMEVVTLPSLLIMDEPTSGLDACGCQQLVEHCKLLCDGLGMTIVAVVHQPRYSSFELFDNVLLLSRYGTVFEGSPTAALVYFAKGLDLHIDKTENPADVLMDVIAADAEALVATWADRGRAWVSAAGAIYPWALYADALKETVVATAEVAAELQQPQEAPGTETARLGSDVTRGPCCLQAGLNMKRLQEACARGFLSGRYDSVMGRIDLLRRLPKPITAHNHAATLVLAYRFGIMLMHRIGRTVLRCSEQAGDDDDTRLMLLSMVAKATHRKRRARESPLALTVQHSGCAQLLGLWGSGRATLNILLRRLIMVWRSPWHIQLLVPMAAACIIGGIQGVQDAGSLTSWPNTIVSAMVCLAVLSMITHVRSFSLDKVTIKRETECKLGLLPFFMAYNLVDLLWLALVPLVFCVPYYQFTLPRSEFGVLLGTAIMVCWWTSGLAYVISALPLALHWANLIAVFVSVIFGAFIQGLDPSVASATGLAVPLVAFSYNRWAMEVLTIAEYRHYDPGHASVILPRLAGIGLCGLSEHEMGGRGLRAAVALDAMLSRGGVTRGCDEHMRRAYLALFGYGIAFRLAAYIMFEFNTNPLFRSWTLGHVRAWCSGGCRRL